MNILPAGNKLPVQRGFSKNGTDDLLPVLRFLGGLYNFSNFVIACWTLVRQHPVKSLLFSFNVSHDMKKSNIFYIFGNDQILPKNVQLKLQVYVN